MEVIHRVQGDHYLNNIALYLNNKLYFCSSLFVCLPSAHLIYESVTQFKTGVECRDVAVVKIKSSSSFGGPEI